MDKHLILLNQIKRTKNFIFEKYQGETDPKLEEIWKIFQNKLEDIIALGEDLNELDD